MDIRLKQAYTNVINKHYAAVQTDTKLEHTDSWELERKAKQFWEDYHKAESEFKALLERCILN